MDLHLAIHFNADRDIEAAALRNEPEMVRRVSFGVDKAVMLLESWLLRSGGQVVQSGGCDFQGQVPADRLDELLDVLRQTQEATESSTACGVGAEPAEALTALQVARHRGGNPSVVLYTPEVAQEADQDKDGELDPILPSETDALEGDRQEQAPVPAGTMQKAQFGNEPSPGEATKIQQGALSPTAAQASAPGPQSPPPAPASPSEGAGAPGQASGDPLLQAVGQVLMQVKQQLPSLEKLKQENQPAYDSVVAMAQAIIALAQKLTGGQPAPGGAPVQKSEGKAPAAPRKCVKCGITRRQADKHCSDLLDCIDCDRPICDNCISEGTESEPRCPDCHKDLGKSEAPLAKTEALFRSACAAYGKKIGKAEWTGEGLDQEAFANGFFHEQRQSSGHLDDHATALKVLENLLRNPKCYEGAPREPPTLQLRPPSMNKDEPHPARPLKPTPSGHHNLNLPPGSVRDQKVKVVHSDGKMSWVQVKAGQITSEDGHPISSRNPGGR